MNQIGVLLIGAAIRCTALALLGTLMYAALRRKGPGAGSLVSLTTLMMLVGVTALSLSPWPRWWTVAPPDASQASRPQKDAPLPAREADRAPADRAPADAAGPNSPARLAAEVGEPKSAAFLRELWREVRHPSVAAGEPRWGWLAWSVVVFLAGAVAALFRLVLGLRAVHLLRDKSEAIDDPDLRDLLDILRAEASCTRNVAIHESSEITTPATVGWRRPMILLPACWREWDEPERRVVLAHELAHVDRNDYLSGLLAQLSLALHFYHPLAHWLMGRLRLQQELAADAWGARLAGGNPLYLTTLAQMALRQADRPVSWPARAFLPTRGTFLRRIEMLRDAKTLPPSSLPGVARMTTVDALVAAGLLIAGLRGGDGPNAAFAQATPTAAAAGDSGAASAPFDLTFVPAATDLLLAARPAVLLARPEFKPIVEILKQDDGSKGVLSLPLDEIDQALVLWLRPEGRPEPDGRANVLPEPSAVILRSAKARDWKSLAAGLIGETISLNHMGQAYNRAAKGTQSYFTPDDRTMVMASEADLQFLIASGKGAASRHAWDEAWKQVDKGQVTIAMGSSWITQRLLPKLNVPGDPPGTTKFDAFSPLWTKAHGYAVGLDFSKGLSIDITAACGTEEGAEKVDQTARALLTLAGNVMDGFRRQIGNAPREAVEPMQLIADTIDPLLEKASSVHKGRIVHVRSSIGADLEGLVKVLVPAVQAARAATKRVHSLNNLKQLALAMHNYASQNGKFPPAVLIGPDGKTPYSWRVAILPYLEQKTVYDRYKFDEPWDGPNNRKLLDQMPDIYRYSSAEGGHNAAYFALVGPETLFGVPGGTEFTQITDGTSNTIMLVEAKRDIPWTKPEDIPYDAAKPLPELGGYTPRGFNAAFADGVVRYISSKIDETVLRALITRAGGEVVSIP